MIDLPFSDQFWNINKRDEDHLDVFSLVWRGIPDLRDILCHESIAMVVKDSRVGIGHTDLLHLLYLIARFFQ